MKSKKQKNVKRKEIKIEKDDSQGDEAIVVDVDEMGRVVLPKELYDEWD